MSAQDAVKRGGGRAACHERGGLSVNAPPSPHPPNGANSGYLVDPNSTAGTRAAAFIRPDWHSNTLLVGQHTGRLAIQLA